MVEFILSLPTWAGCILAMICAAVFGFTVYIVFYKFISMFPNADLKDPNSSLFRVVGMLLSLMLALAFAEVMGDLKTIRNAVQRESVAILDIYEVLKLYDIEKTQEIRATLVYYAQAVIDDDWPALANDKLGSQARALKNQLAKSVMNLKPATPTQEKLLSFLMADIDLLSDYRLIRLDAALAKPSVYVYINVFGFLVTMACFGAYRPQTPLMVLVFFYTIFIGLVLYIVLQLSDPFQGDIGVHPSAFKYLVEMLRPEIG